MKKEEVIKRYGEEAYEKLLEQNRAWHEAHPDKVIAKSQEQCRKGGRYYGNKLIYQHTSLQGARNIIRRNHRRQYRQYKNIIAPESQVHHQWIPETSEYTGVALVEADRHMHGFVDVIKILDGEITLLTEKEIRNAG